MGGRSGGRRSKDAGFPGELEQMVMLAALRLGDEAYGAAIGQSLEASVGRRVSRGSIYVTLDRLESKGWIRSSMSAPLPERGGRPRRIVEVTAAGVDRLRRSRSALETLWDGLEPLAPEG